MESICSTFTTQQSDKEERTIYYSSLFTNNLLKGEKHWDDRIMTPVRCCEVKY